MFVGFNVSITEQGIFSPHFYQYGVDSFNQQKLVVQNRLESYALDDGILDATRIEEDWFPDIDTNVFISHSHRDQKLAIGLAGWMHKLFGIESFIDSCVWGYADNLLKIIDDSYCVTKQGENGNTYNYSKRNQSTTHIHLILNTALQKMIDKTECLIFLNTPNSLLVDDVINGSATASPWIYSELTFSRVVRKRKLSEYRPQLSHDALLEFSQLNVKYDVSLSHLVDLGDSDLLQIWIHSRQKGPYEALDDLYTNLGLMTNEGLINGD